MVDTQRVIVGNGFQNPVERFTAIDCVFCGLKEDISLQSPLVRLERFEYHRRRGCVTNDLGLQSNDWDKKWRGEQ